MDEKVFEFKRQLKRLVEYRGSGTELISVYIPSGSPIHETAAKLREEMSQASNIKSKSTRTNVTGALEKILQHFKIYRETPKNGLAVFAGNVSENPAKVDIELFTIETPQPVGVGAYRCDSKFFLEPLERMVDTQDEYGIVVLDGREATLATVKGTYLHVVKRLNSTAHQKVGKGGQCLAPNTLVQKSDGDICEIRTLKAGDKIKAAHLQKNIIQDFVCSDIFKTQSKTHHIIRTYAPGRELVATPYHRFLVLSEFGIKEKYAKDLSPRDKLLVARRVPHTGTAVPLRPTVNQAPNTQAYSIPPLHTPEFAYLLGVVCGGGTVDGNRIILYEGHLDLAQQYVVHLKNLFAIDAVLKTVDKTHQKGSFAKKPYYEIRIYSLQIVNTILNQCKEVVAKTEERAIPLAILQSDALVLAAFLKGLFDAEGYLDNRMVRIAGTSKKLIHLCSLALLRLGIISSFQQKTVKGNPQWQTTISDFDSVCNFRKLIGFSRSDKANTLGIICSSPQSSQQYSDQIPFHGRQVYHLIKEMGLRSRDFGSPGFFTGKKSMGRQAFQRLISKISDKLPSSKWNWAVELLAQIHGGDLSIAEVSENLHVDQPGDFYDLTIPEAANFMANGIIVHNSQRRFQRLVEEEIEYYYKRVGNAMDEHFLPKKVKGVIVGGPGPTKHNLVKMAPYNYQFKILGVVDTGYTDDYGLREVLGKSEDILAGQELIQEKQLVDRFIKEAVTDGLATYGERQVREAILSGQAEKVLLSEELSYRRASYACGSCAHKEEKTSKEKPASSIPCPHCKADMKLESEQSLLDELIDLAKNSGIEVALVSANSTEGAQFLSGFAGVGALLRYKTK